MSDKVFPEKLKLFREEGSEQDHYFIIVDEGGDPISSMKWYPIQYGSLYLSLSSFQLCTTFTQDIEEFPTKKKVTHLKTFDSISGEGVLEEGTINSTLAPSISIFGSSHEQKTLDVGIRPRTDDGEEYFILGGYGDDFWDGDGKGTFYLEFFLTNERFNRLKENCLSGVSEKIFIEIDLGRVSSLYSGWAEFIGTEFGKIKILKRYTDIINKDEFEDKFVEDLKMELTGQGQEFSITTQKKIGNF
tara:strand:- start:123 stop:857 length:735 start_codon:yes stop_codon:yes gene_type:complete